MRSHRPRADGSPLANGSPLSLSRAARAAQLWRSLLANARRGDRHRRLGAKLRGLPGRQPHHMAHAHELWHVWHLSRPPARACGVPSIPLDSSIPRVPSAFSPRVLHRPTPACRPPQIPKPLWDEYVAADCRNAPGLNPGAVCLNITGKMDTLTKHLDPYGLDFPK